MSKASLLELCHGEKKYETFSISENNESLLSDCRAKNFHANERRAKLVLTMPSAAENHLCVKCMPIVNKHIEILTSQYIGTCKSAYTKGYAIN